MNVTRRLKALVSAYACNPYSGSEDGVGWGWVTALAKHHDVWVLTGEHNRSDIEKVVPGDTDRYRNVQFSYVPRTRWRVLERCWPPSYLWTYRLWQRDAYRLGVQLHKQISFDLAHQLTYVGFRVPGHLWKLGIPFVWGPIGGLENTPWRFLPALGLKGCLYYACRNIVNSLHKRSLVLPKRAFRRARGGIIAATEGIRREIQQFYGEDSEVICEVGAPRTTATTHSTRSDGEALRIAWSGQHLPGKALPLLLRAAAGLPEQMRWELRILGQGPCTGKWRRLARKLGVYNRCTWHGWLSRENAVAVMRDAHVFVITSLKDLTSTVLVEALSQGLPIVCLDHCGFRTAVTDDCGLRVPLSSPHRAIQGVRDAIATLWDDEDLRHKLAAGALARSEAFSWERKAKNVDSIYRRVVREDASTGA